MSRSHFLRDVLRGQEPCGLVIERESSTLVNQLEIAGDSAARRRGLLGRNELDRAVGYVIAPTQGVHTFGMRFPIDIVGVARDGRVVKIRSHVPPRRLVFAWSAFAILELAAGVVESTGLRVGDRLVAMPAASTR